VRYQFVVGACVVLLEATQAQAWIRHCFRHSDGATTTLGTLGGLSCRTADINEAGQIVGQSDLTPGLGRHAFLFEDGVMTDLGTLGGDESMAQHVSPSGIVTGWSETATGAIHAFLYQSGTMIDLGAVGVTDSYGYTVNDSGQVAGRSGHGFLYDDGLMTDLGTLGGYYSDVTDMNASGQVVGYSSTIAEAERKVFLYESGTMTDLGTLGGRDSHPYDLNDAGQIVGVSRNASGESHAFLHDGGSMIDLGGFGGEYSYARSINEAGQILVGADVSGVFHTFLQENGLATDLGPGSPVALGESGTVLMQGSDFPILIADGMRVDLLPMGDAHFAEGFDVNSSGTAVGNFGGYMCPPSPYPGCLEAGHSTLKIRIAPIASRNKLLWKWARGNAFEVSNTPSDAMLCLYDSVAGVPALVAKLTITTSRYWKWNGLGAGGLSYRGRYGYDYGVKKARIRGGFTSNQTSVQLAAAGEGVPLPLPAGSDRFFHQDGNVVVQLFHDDVPACWTSVFSEARSNTATEFTAIAP
jgi:probable HAF family extracellular repeat protein